MTTVLAVIVTTVVGLMVGVEFAVAFVLNPILIRLPAGASMAGRADGGRMLGRAMPFWYVGSLIVTVAFAAVASSVAAFVAAGLLAVSVVLSVALLVPINNRSKTWTADNHPDDWREQQQRWDRLHYGRVGLIVAAFVLVATAATTA